MSEPSQASIEDNEVCGSIDADWQETLRVLSLPCQRQDRAIVIYLAGPCPEGKFYIGQTENFAVRMACHRRADGACPSFHAALQQFGFDRLSPRIIAQTDSPDEADILERRYIKLFNALFPHGYNMTLGGRATQFDPKLRITGFAEMPVSNDEIRQAALNEIEPSFGPTPDDYPDRAHQWLTHYLHEAIAAGKPMEDLNFSENPKLLKLCRDLEKFDHYEELAVRALNLPRREKRKARPYALKLYGERLFGYIHDSLRVKVLRSRGLPFRHLKPFRPVAESSKQSLKEQQHQEYVRKLLQRRLNGQSFVEGHAALVDTFLLEHKKGFPFSPDTALQVGFEPTMITNAVEEAKQRIARGEKLEDYQRERREELEQAINWAHFVPKDWRPGEQQVD